MVMKRTFTPHSTAAWCSDGGDQHNKLKLVFVIKLESTYPERVLQILYGYMYTAWLKYIIGVQIFIYFRYIHTYVNNIQICQMRARRVALTIFWQISLVSLVRWLVDPSGLQVLTYVSTHLPSPNPGAYLGLWIFLALKPSPQCH